MTPALAALLLTRDRKAEGRVFHRDESGHRRRHGVDRVDAARPDPRPVCRRDRVPRAARRHLLGLNLVPTGFVPEEDQGYFIVIVQAPPGASLEYTRTACRQIERHLMATPEVQNVFAISGFGFAGLGAEPGHRLRQPEAVRRAAGRGALGEGAFGRLFGAFSQITGAMVFPFLPPSIQGLSQFGGFTYELLDQSGGSIAESRQRGPAADCRRATGRRGWRGCSPSSPPTIRSLRSTIDREKAKSLGLSLGDITDTMQICSGRPT